MLPSSAISQSEPASADCSCESQSPDAAAASSASPGLCRSFRSSAAALCCSMPASASSCISFCSCSCRRTMALWPASRAAWRWTSSWKKLSRASPRCSCTSIWRRSGESSCDSNASLLADGTLRQRPPSRHPRPSSHAGILAGGHPWTRNTSQAAAASIASIRSEPRTPSTRLQRSRQLHRSGAFTSMGSPRSREGSVVFRGVW
mmetsp:Transcript_99491/g.276874  ORF Transcript_99491/g.276874 Transcript_99491/m.276874 type:complete len:204 (+) Transcript_99491:150-761(+)